MFTAAGLGGISFADVGYAVKTVLGLMGKLQLKAFSGFRGFPSKRSRTRNLLLLGARLLGLAFRCRADI
jgi:hypothetical protein